MTPLQFQTLIDVISLNPELISGKLTPSFRVEDRKKKWEALATVLNSAGLGPGKSTYKWRMIWEEEKIRIRAKAVTIQLNSDEVDSSEILTDLEKQVLNMIKSTTSTDDSEEREIIELDDDPVFTVEDYDPQVNGTEEWDKSMLASSPQKRKQNENISNMNTAGSGEKSEHLNGKKRKVNGNISDIRDSLKSIHQQMEHQTTVLKKQARLMEDIATSLHLIAASFQNKSAH